MIDYLIVGGGSAGCVLAARLSEESNLRVVLVEAGSDLVPGAMPEDIASGYPGQAFLNGNYTWPRLTALMGYDDSLSAGKRLPRNYEQARLLGGGSSINAMAANRGAPSDYDEWEQMGAVGWNWKAVLPYFRKLEHDLDLDGPYHGKSGPVMISRRRPSEHSEFVKAVCSTLEKKGYVPRDDQNGPWEDGIYPVAIARNRNDQREPAAASYLCDETRARQNLEIKTGTHVRRLLWQGRRVIGAEIDGPNGPEAIYARETVVSCGAIHTPALLMRSGIGQAEQLRLLGIEARHNLPGVGKNLMEHPSVAISAFLKPHARLRNETNQIQACLRLSSGNFGCPRGDLHVAIVAKAAWHGVGQRLGTMLAWVNKSYSRGEVTLVSSDPLSPPAVDFRLLSDKRDRARLAQAVRITGDVMQDSQLREVTGQPFPAWFSDRVRMVSRPNAFNAIKTAIFGTILDLSFGLREHLIGSLVSEGVRLDAIMQDDAAMDEFLTHAVSGTWHASGTCRMGAASDPYAVTDPEGHVHGVAGLRICDASLMPSIPCANTNLPVLMMAERVADIIKDRHVAVDAPVAVSIG